ncbi:MAG: GGDEF domain-containing protein [Thermoanaerobaculum sp.]|nr:GGDEF domain-containing protein [Thermoanaerobaculum sp.]MDW7968016.1 GGDEF domain-containing protein [Thermoanaerobaculum sp.]
MEKEQRLALWEASGKAERLVRWALLAGLLACLLLLGALASRYHDRLRVERVIAQKNAELEAAYARLAELSRTDELTSLPNRRATLDFLVAEENRARQGSYTFSVVLCDLDDLKAWNDTFGHECGDAVLEEFAHTLVQNLRASDFVGRWGGDEFLIVLPATDQPGALLLAEKLRQAIAEKPLAWEGHFIHLRATFGVHQWAGESVRVTISGADEALYRGKREGKDQVRW